jgi:hypothetical protein
LNANRCAQCRYLAFAQFEQRSRQRRNPADQTAPDISLIHADNAVSVFAPVFVANCHGCAEEYLIAFPALRRINHLRLFQALAQETHAPVNFAQAFFTVDIIAVFGAVAVRCRPGNSLHQLGALYFPELFQLVFQLDVSAGSDVIFYTCRQLGRWLQFVIGDIVLWAC